MEMELQNNIDAHETPSTKEDDFFDDEPPKQQVQQGDVLVDNKDIENNVQPEKGEEENKETTDKEGGDASGAVTEGDVSESAFEHEPDVIVITPAADNEEGEEKESTQADDTPAPTEDTPAETEDTPVETEDTPAPAEEIATDVAEDEEVQQPVASEEPADEGFQSTSPPPTAQVPVVVVEEDDTPPQQDEGATHDELGDVEEEQKADNEQINQPSAIEEHDIEENPDSKPEVGEANAEDIPSQSEAVNEQQQQEGEEALLTTPDVVVSDKSYKDDYDDDVSECSQKSLVSVDSTGKTPNTRIEETISGADVENEQDERKSPMVNGLMASPAPASPSPSDGRAGSAGAVDPQEPPPARDNRDDRSSVSSLKDNGEFRGEDRTDLAPPEGMEDSRGQGQWKSAEQQYVASAVIAQQGDKEALKEMQEERDRLVEDKEGLTKTLEGVELELSQKCDLLVAEREITAGKDKKIKGLMEELSFTISQLGEGHEERIKELQERLAQLARENEAKDKKIEKLNENLKSTKRKLEHTEHRLSVVGQERDKAVRASQSSGDAPKSKTCILM